MVEPDIYADIEIKEDQFCWENKLPMNNIKVTYYPIIKFTTIGIKVTV